MYYILGLGNPGDTYDGTRHNIGRATVAAYGRANGFADWNKSSGARAHYARGVVSGTPVELLLPDTFMNRSGETARYVVEKHNATPNEFIVVHDDIDLPLGTVRVAYDRGHGGHNGVKSVAEHLSSTAFVRIRIGIAPTSFWTGDVKRPSAGGALERFVLGRFTRGEQPKVEDAIERAHAAIAKVVTDGVERAMNACNASE